MVEVVLVEVVLVELLSEDMIVWLLGTDMVALLAEVTFAARAALMEPGTTFVELDDLVPVVSPEAVPLVLPLIVEVDVPVEEGPELLLPLLAVEEEEEEVIDAPVFEVLLILSDESELTPPLELLEEASVLPPLVVVEPELPPVDDDAVLPVEEDVWVVPLALLEDLVSSTSSLASLPAVLVMSARDSLRNGLQSESAASFLSSSATFRSPLEVISLCQVAPERWRKDSTKVASSIFMFSFSSYQWCCCIIIPTVDFILPANLHWIIAACLRVRVQRTS